MSAGALAVIAKAPRAGRSKTRLCPPCTPQQAADLARAALQDTLAALLDARCHRRILVLDGEPGDWLPRDAGIEVVAQRGAGLGERLAAAFADVGGPLFLVGMDTPQIAARDLEAGLAALLTHDAVLGPSPDGGYWGIGLRGPRDDVFAGVPMSSSTTRAAQERRLLELGLGCARLRALRDVDTFADARLVANEARSSRFAAALALISSGEAAA